MIDTPVFVLAAAMVLVGALGVVLRTNPVHCALSLVLTLFGIAVLFVAQDANFLAAVQVIVYAGAIVVLFLFVIMLLGVDRTEDLEVDRLKGQRPLAAAFGVVVLGARADGRLRRPAAAVITGQHSVSGRAAPTGEPDINLLARNRSSPTTCSPSRSRRVLLVIAVRRHGDARPPTHSGRLVEEPEYRAPEATHVTSSPSLSPRRRGTWSSARRCSPSAPSACWCGATRS